MWTDAWKASIRKLDDRFGDFILVVICGQCGHRRQADPKALAKLAGVEPSTPIDAVVPRLRCMQCHQKAARWEVERPPRPRGHGFH